MLQRSRYWDVTNVFCDNKSAIFFIKSGANSFKGKHIDIKYHYIQDIVER